jgi:hypothetical protein
MNDGENDHDPCPMVCAVCAIDFFITYRFRGVRTISGENFFCPNGHPQHYPKPENSITLLRERIAELEREVTELKIDKAQLTHKLEQTGVET